MRLGCGHEEERGRCAEKCDELGSPDPWELIDVDEYEQGQHEERLSSVRRMTTRIWETEVKGVLDLEQGG